MKDKIKIKSSFVNLPNILTIFRIVSIPIFVVCLFRYSFTSSIIAYVLFLLASISDYFDGYIARKYNLTTEFGAFVDPLSDKLLTGTAFISFYFIKALYIPLWMIVIIIFREILVTVFRIIALKKNRPMKTEFAGKLKTAFQMFTINVILIYLIIYYYILKNIEYSLSIQTNIWSTIINGKLAGLVFYLPAILIFICAVLSLISMSLYIVKNRYLFS